MDQQSTGQPAEPFNGLTPAQAERLAMLAEECGEIIQVVGKILRHGYDSFHPENPGCRNGGLLGLEVADFEAVLQLMTNAGDPYYKVEQDDVAEAMQRKLRYAHHQAKPGVVPNTWPDGTPRNLPPQYYPEAAPQPEGQVRALDDVDVQGWAAFKCHALPTAVARHIAECANVALTPAPDGIAEAWQRAIGIVGNTRAKQQPGPLFAVLKDLLGEMEDARRGHLRASEDRK